MRHCAASAAAGSVPVERRPWITVDSVSRGLSPERVLAAELSGEDLVETLRQNPGSDFVVTVGEDVLGVLRVADVIQQLQTKEPDR